MRKIIRLILVIGMLALLAKMGCTDQKSPEKQLPNKEIVDK